MGTALRSRWKAHLRAAVVIVVLLIVAPFLILHLLVLCVQIFKPKLTGVTVGTVRFPSGRSLRFYRLDKPNSTANLGFIHGSPATADAFHAQFKDSFGDVSILVCDRPGYGGSPPVGDSNDLQAQVSALGSLLNSIEAANCILIGHSYGGAVALKAAIDHPQFVRGILLIGGSVDPGQEKVLLVQRVGAWPLIRRLIPEPLDCRNRELLALKADLLTLQTRLSLLHAHVLILHGTKDRLVPPVNVEFLQHELEKVGKTNLFAKMIVPGGNHFLPSEHPEIVHNAIHELLRACESGHQDLPKPVLRRM